MSDKFEKSKGLMVFEMIVYAAMLVWFLSAFLPIGLQ
jgi:hypothetical protein